MEDSGKCRGGQIMHRSVDQSAIQISIEGQGNYH